MVPNFSGFGPHRGLDLGLGSGSGLGKLGFWAQSTLTIDFEQN